MAQLKGQNSIVKKKLGPQLGFRTPSFIRGKNFSNKGTGGFNPGRFKTQHKG